MTTPGAYQAGTAFLEVVPSFRGVQEAIGREVKKMEGALGKKAGDEFGKNFESQAVKAVDKALDTSKAKAAVAGKETADAYAGRFAEQFKTAMGRAQRDFKNIDFDIKFDDKDLQKRFRSLKSDFERLSKVKIGANMDAGPALREIGRIETKLLALQDASADLNLRTNLGAIAAEFEAFRKRIEKDAGFKIEPEIKMDRQLGLFEKAIKKTLAGALENFPPVEFDADITPAQQRLQELRQELITLRDKRIGIDIGGEEANAELERLRVSLAALARDTSVDIDVRTNAAGAAAELLGIRALAKLVDETEVDVNVKVKTDTVGSRLDRLRNQLLGTRADGEDAANSFRAFNAVVLAGATLIPAVVPVIGALAGALALVGPTALAAVAGIGVLAFAFSGLGDAVKALGDVEENAAKDSAAASKARAAQAKKVADAARSVEDAERSVSRARTDAARAARDASRAVEDAVDRQEDAERDLVDAQEDALRAQEAVTQAREAAADRIEDLRFRLEGGALAERQAVIDLAEAREAYQEALDDPDATQRDRDQLLIDLEREELGLKRLRVENERLGEDRDEANRTGIEGSEEVQRAQEGVASAEERVRDAMEQVADASRGVQDAILSQRETNADAAERVADAQRNLTEAQTRYQEALFETAEVGSTSMQALETAMGKLGPAGQSFAAFIHSLRGDFAEMRNIVQGNIFPALETGIANVMAKNGPLFNEFLDGMSTAIGNVIIAFGDLLTSPQWQAIFASFNEYMPTLFEQLAEISGNLLTFFGELFVALAPYAERFNDALIGITESMADWAAGLNESSGFKGFMEWLFENGGSVFSTVWNILGAVGAIIIALEPLGTLVLDMLENVAEFIKEMDPDTLGTILTLMLGLVVAFQLGVGASALVIGALSIFATTAGAVVFVIGAIIAGLIALYTQSETARDIIDAVLGFLGDVITWWWKNVVFPVFGFFIDVLVAIGDAAVWLWEKALMPTFRFIGDAWTMLFEGMMWAWDNILKPLWDIISFAAKVLFALLVVAIFGPMAAAWEAALWVFDKAWNNILKPLWELVKKGAAALMDFLQPAFEDLGIAWDAMAKVFSIVGIWIRDNVFEPFRSWWSDLEDDFKVFTTAMGIIWEGLKANLAAPVNFVIKWVLNNGLFAAFNKVIDTFGLPDSWKMDNAGYIKVAGKTPGLAAGGRVPGWSPNDKADNIPAMLTAGEWVQPVDTVNYYGPEFMEAIRKKRVPRDVMQYFSSGGSVQHLASGGQIYAATRRVFPRAKLNSAFRFGDPGYHGRDQAADLGEMGFPGGAGRPYIAAMKRWWVDNYGRTAAEIIYNGLGNDRPNIKNGRPLSYSLATQLQHLNHLHVAYPGLLGAVGGSGMFAGIGASGTVGVEPPLWKKLWNNVTDVLGGIKDSVTRPLENLASKFGDNPFVKALSGTPGKAIGWVWDKIKTTLGSLYDALDLFGDDSPAVVPTGDVQNKVKAVADRYGWGGGTEWSALARLVQKESSWNPQAQNPTSTAYGLFQFLNGTWGGTGIAKTSDPVRQAQAGLRYIKDRYGSPSAALAFHNRNNWYSEGGEVGNVGPGVAKTSDSQAPTLYDSGGWLPPGVSTVINATNRPEPILTAAQWDDLLGSGNGSDPGVGGFRELHLHEVAYDPAQSVGQLNHAVRVLQRGGRYAGVGD